MPALDCAEELRLIEKALRNLPGLEQVTPDYLARQLYVDFDPEQLSSGEIAARLEASGFPAQMAATESTSKPDRPSVRDAATAAGGALLLTAGLLHLATDTSAFVIAALLILSTLASGVFVAGAALRAVRLWALDMNALMTVAACGAIALGEHFEAATAMFLFGVALWLEAHSLDRARHAVRSLLTLTPLVAHRLNGRDVVDVDPDQLEPEDRVLVRPGERVPVDGIVESGSTVVDQAPITGESLPVEKSPGDTLYGGTLNGESAVEVRVLRPARESTLAHIARLVEQAHAARSPTQRFVDQFARVYTPVVVLLALLTACVVPLAVTLGLLPASDGTLWTPWIHRGLVLLVIACPCALVISTPVTIVCGLHQAARQGVIIKGGEHLEQAALIDAMAFDKTGTLTVGTPHVAAVLPHADLSESDLLATAAALEQHSEHPFAAAIVSATEEHGVAIPEVREATALRGFGVRGEIDGALCHIGSRRLMRDLGIVPGNDEWATSHNAASRVYIARGDQLLGTIRLSDRLREDATSSLNDLRRLGVRQLVAITGDNRADAVRITEPLELDELHADLLPEDKLRIVEQLAAKHDGLAVVGDGVNDAPALAGADIGIALGSQSSDTALETADVVVMTPRLSRLVDLVRLAHRCRSLLWQNIAIALGIKLAVFALAAAGQATLWMAVAADVGASLLVIFNGMRILGPR